MTTLEKQTHKIVDGITETKMVRDFLRLWKDGHRFVRVDARHWECRKADGTTYQIYVDHTRQVCTCPAYGVCAHIHGVWVMQRMMPELATN